MIITSRSNPVVKALRALQRRKDREEQQRFLVEGIRAVAEAVQLRAPIEQLIVAPDLLSNDFARGLVADFQRAGGRVLEVSAEVLESLSSREHPQGLLAVVSSRLGQLNDLTLSAVEIVPVLTEVADPGNLGTIMRSADAVGVRALILLGNATDPFDPATLRAAMGALFNLQIVRCSWPELRDWQQQHGALLLGSSDRGAADYRQITVRRPLLLLMGSERHGLNDEQLAACDAVARIPMRGRSDSLNLAVATSVLLYELTRDLP
jgi:TrmH family RNA methyltransferase